MLDYLFRASLIQLRRVYAEPGAGQSATWTVYSIWVPVGQGNSKPNAVACNVTSTQQSAKKRNLPVLSEAEIAAKLTEYRNGLNAFEPNYEVHRALAETLLDPARLQALGS